MPPKSWNSPPIDVSEIENALCKVDEVTLNPPDPIEVKLITPFVAVSWLFVRLMPLPVPNADIDIRLFDVTVVAVDGVLPCPLSVMFPLVVVITTVAGPATVLKALMPSEIPLPACIITDPIFELSACSEPIVLPPLSVIGPNGALI